MSIGLHKVLAIVVVFIASAGVAAAAELPSVISVESVPMILDPGKVPGDQGEVGKTTLAGVDANKNGVRDDVERWIGQTFPKCARYRAALAQVAFVVQRKIVTEGMDEKTAKALATEEAQATGCFAEASQFCEEGSLEKFIQLSIMLQNTPQRATAYLRALKFTPKTLATNFNGCMVPLEQLPN